jgi:hypothetical protein
MTTYRVSGARSDMHRLVSLCREQKRKCPPLLWPLALAEEGRDLVAAVGTHCAHGIVIAGPVAIRDSLGRRAWMIAYRLGQLYDHAMAASGVRTYYGHVSHALPQWAYVLERLGYEPVPVPGELGQWFRRHAGQPWGQQIDSTHAEPVDGLRQRLRATPIDALGSRA